MTTDATIHTGAAPARREPMPVIERAGAVLLAAGAFGVVGQLLFFDVGVGVNFPIAVGLLLAGGWILRRPHARIDGWDMWLAPAALVLAIFPALRADPTIVAVDILAAVGLCIAALASLGGRSVVARAFWTLPSLAVGLVAWIGGGAVIALSSARRRLPPASSLDRYVSPAAPVLRGLVIAVPIAVVFVALFSAADAVFAQLVGDLVEVELDLGDAGWRVALGVVLAWVAAGALAIVASEPAPAAASSRRADLRIGAGEVLTVLVVVNAIFAVFVVLQATYLFGGLDTLAASGLTYAEYARRGFAELVVVAILAGALAIGADQLARPRTTSVVIGTIGLTALTGVVVASAAMRLMLYQDAYGWTELRFYVLATIGWLAVGTLGLAVAIVLDRVRWIGHALVAAALLVGLVLNVIGPARFITEQNVARLLDPSLVPPNGRTGLDAAYVVQLGDDAVPALLRAPPALDGPSAAVLAQSLAFRLDELRDDPGLSAWQAWNAGREAARDALEAAEARGELR
jgi:hypothetical protein